MEGIQGARRRRTAALLTVAVAVSAVGACSGTADEPIRAASDTSAVADATSGAAADASAVAPCQHSPGEPVAATPVEGSESDLDVTSFDGTTIRAHWFPLEGTSVDAPAPVVLMGPGWGLPGDTDVETVGVFGALNISTLHDAGFHVLTWDPRGFGASEGTAAINAADTEGRDVQVLLDWTAEQPAVALDGPGDPRSGMIGGSYGGGIQLTTAAIDCRVDALVPIVAWHSLETSLFKAATPKTGWSNLLIRVSATGSVDERAIGANESANATGTVSDEDLAWFVDRGPAGLVEQIRAPTLLVHGTVDTLFTLDEAITNYEILRGNDVPAGLHWFCGGHGACLTHDDDAERTGRAAIAWLQRWVHDDPSIDTGPQVELIDQRGATYPAEDYPLPTGDPVTAGGAGTLELVAEGGAVPPTPAGDAGVVGGLALPITPGPAANAVEVAVAVPDEPVLVVGAPELSLTYTGTVPDGERPTRVFAQLVDDRTGLVLGNQITPIEVTLDGETHTTTVAMEVVSFATTPGAGLTLQLVATTVAYAEPRLGGEVAFDSIELALPVAAGITPQVP